jgi:hypothetical protein
MTFATCYRKVEKKKAKRLPQSQTCRRVPWQNARRRRGKPSVTHPRPPRQIISRVAHWLAWEDVGVSGLPVSSNPPTPGRSQMSRVLYNVLRFVPTSNTGLTSLHLREGLKDPEGLMCRDRVRCWPRPGRAPWRRRCGKFLCRLSAYRILILTLMLTRLRRSFNAPVSSFWKANSTLLASKAEVSMKESPFSLAKLLAYAENRVSIVSQKSWVASLCHIPPPWAQPEGASNRSCFPPA